MAVLPSAATEDAFTTVCRDEAALRPGVERLCRRLGVDMASLMRRLPEPAQPVLGALADRWFATELARNQPGSDFPAGVPDSSPPESLRHHPYHA